jgi:hypothetical protein
MGFVLRLQYSDDRLELGAYPIDDIVELSLVPHHHPSASFVLLVMILVFIVLINLGMLVLQGNFQEEQYDLVLFGD